MSTVSGVPTYLDIQKLIEQNVAKERTTIEQIQTKRQLYETAKTDWNTVRSAFSNLRISLNTLKQQSVFYSRAASVSNSDVVTANAASTAALTSYALTDITLARAAARSGVALGLADGTATYHQSTGKINVEGSNINPNLRLDGSQGATNIDGTLTAGSITINGATIMIDPAADTLNTVLSKINSSVAGVTATFDGAANNNSIRITSNTAAEESITFASGASNFFSLMNIDTETATQQGVDADWQRPLAELGVGSPLANVADGYFMINNVVISVDTATDTLQDIINRINGSQAGVSVFYNEETDALEIQAKETGKNIVFGDANNTGDSAGFLSNVLGIDLSGGTVTTAFTAAAVTVNGSTLHPDGNTFTINGTTFTLHADLHSGSANVEVSRDTAKAKTAIEGLVTNYNALAELLDEKSQVGGTLHNDWLVNRMRSQMRTYVIGSVANSGEYEFLRDVGVEYGNGRLSLNEATLTTAFRDNPDSVASIFGYDADGDGVRNDGGFANSFANNFISPLMLYSTGDISQRVDYLDTRIDYTEKDQAKIEAKIAQKQIRLQKEYTSLMEYLAKVTQIQQWMTNQLSTLNDFSLSLYSSKSSS